MQRWSPIVVSAYQTTDRIAVFNRNGVVMMPNSASSGEITTIARLNQRMRLMRGGMDFDVLTETSILEARPVGEGAAFSLARSTSSIVSSSTSDCLVDVEEIAASEMFCDICCLVATGSFNYERR